MADSDDEDYGEQVLRRSLQAPSTPSPPPATVPPPPDDETYGEQILRRALPASPTPPGAPPPSVPFQPPPPSPPDAAPEPGPFARIGQAAIAGYQESPPLVTQPVTDYLNRSPLGRYIYNPLLAMGGAAAGGLNALGAGEMQAVHEAGEAIDPRLGRDLPMLAQVLLPAEMARPGGFGGRVSAMAPEALTPTTPATAAGAKAVAAAYYQRAEAAGGTLTPQFTNRFIDSVHAASPQTAAGQAVAGENAVTGLAARLEALRDQPMSLQGAQEVDEALGNLISSEYGVRGLSKDGVNLQGVQRSFRDQIANAGAGDITGGTAGFDALGPARQAWAQAMKMDDIERAQQRADMTDNPTTSFRTQMRTLVNNATRSRGYSDDEIAALKAASDRGLMGGVLHTMGSRLIPIVTGAAEAVSGGGLQGIGTGIGTHLGQSVIRWAANKLQDARVARAKDVLNQRVPPMPGAAAGPIPAPTPNPLTGAPLAFAPMTAQGSNPLTGGAVPQGGPQP